MAQADNGLKQGSTFSPIAFILVMDDVIEKWLRGLEKKIKAMAFAVDMLVWGEQEEDVYKQLIVFIMEGAW